MCYDVSDCNNKGYCIKGQCLCDVAWFGKDCTDNLEIFLPRGFSGYRAVFTIIYSVILIVSFVKLYLKLKEEKYMFHGSTSMFLFKAMRSPFNLSMLSIFTIATTRIIWLSIDPFGYDHILHRSLERVLFELTYSLLFLVYAVVLLVWHRIYEELKEDKPLIGQNRIGQDLNISSKKETVKRKKSLSSYASGFWVSNKIKLFVVLVFVAQITTSISKGFYNSHYRWFTLTVYVILFFFLVIITLEYLVFGWLIHRIIQRQQEKIQEYEKSIATLTTGKPMTGVLANALLLGKTVSGRPKNESSIKDSEANELNVPDQSDMQRSSLASPLTDNIQLTTRAAKKRDEVPLKAVAIEIESTKTKKAQPNNQQSSESEEEETEKPPKHMFQKSVDGVPPKPIFAKSELSSDQPVRKDTKARHTIISTGLESKQPKLFKKQASSGKLFKSEEIPFKKSKFHDKKEKNDLRLKEELEKEQQIQMLVSSDISNTKPMSVLETNIAEDVSIIIYDDYNLNWDPINLEEKKEAKLYQIRQEQRKQEMEKNFQKTKEDLAQTQKKVKVQEPETAGVFRLDDYKKMLLKDNAFRRNCLEITENDQKVMRKITTLTVIAIVLEIVFAIVSVVVFQTSFLQHPAAMIFSMWLIGFLEVASIFAIIILFSMVHSQKNKNLQLVMRIGQSSNRINRLYQFKLPQYMTDNNKQEPESEERELVKQNSGLATKKQLQDNINKITSRYIKKLSLVMKKATQK